MFSYISHPFFWVLIYLSLTSHYIVYSTNIPQIYIVYLGSNPQSDGTLISKYHHLRLLFDVFASEEDAKEAMIYSYKHSFSGFSAKLNTTQAMTLSKMDGVVSVFPSKTLQLHTTRSWDYLGLRLQSDAKRRRLLAPHHLAYGGDNVIVGIFDSGVWPESESFQEPCNIGPIPHSWKGKCVKAQGFNPSSACNRKLIGARYYLKGFESQYGADLDIDHTKRVEFRSPRDFLGHGTHTASTAVGSIVNNENVSFMGLLAKGKARGGATRARLAVYKVCWALKINNDNNNETMYEGKCNEADIMAAFDDALHDGVNVISASFGESPPLAPFFASSAAIGSFHAMQRGVTVVFSAGNDGFNPSLVQNVSPWSICVAASTIDRTFPTQIVIDNRIFITGESLITKMISKAKLADAINYFIDGICDEKNIRKMNNRSAAAVGSGRVVLCVSTIGADSTGTAQAALKMINASALIFAAPMTMQLPDVDIIPTVRIDITQATQIKNFLAQQPRLPAVQIGVSQTVIGKLPAPTVAYFSSRGPSSLSPDILKPDISAPGVNILAAWPPEAPLSGNYDNNSEAGKWNFQSGTSMACPHISGVVALIKSAHPNWSPAAIRSALITTATNMDSSGDSILAGGSMKTADPFDVGAGQVNPLKSMDPGLIYDMKTQDYITFLCKIGYTDEQIKMIVNNNFPPQKPHNNNNEVFCSSSSATFHIHYAIANLNYPSISISIQSSSSTGSTIKRTLSNVGGNKNAIYFLTLLVCPNGVRVFVWPRILIFSWFRQEISYYITLIPLEIKTRRRGLGRRYDFGEIVWSDGLHNVRSPLVVSISQ